MSTTNTFYEQQYNMRAQVKDHEVFFDKWAQDSRSARDRLTCHLNVPYGDANRETVDIFPAENSERWLIFTHGGAFRSFSNESFSFLATSFVEGGFNLALVEYDLCPAVTLDTIVDQCRRGIAWVYNHASEYSSDCSQMVITGHSGGGYLTSMMFATDWTQYAMPSDVIVGGIALSGIFDFEPVLHIAGASYLQLDVEGVNRLSPMRLKPLVDAPLIVVDGALESSETHRQMHILKGASDWNAIVSDPISLPDIHHFNILEPFMERDKATWAGLLL